MSGIEDAAVLLRVAEDQELLRHAHRKIEDALIGFRDSRMSMPGCGNGLVVREVDGEPSSMIRMTVQQALRLGMNAIADELAVTGDGGSLA